MAMSMKMGISPEVVRPNQQPMVEFEYEPIEMSSPVGTPEYMPPELATRFLEWSQSDMSDRTYTESCDIWSLGVIAYVLLAGEPPFRANQCNNMHCKWNEGGCCEDCQESLLEEIISCNLSFSSPKWDHISNEAKHFVLICLNRDYHARVSAKELLKHPFVTKVQINKSSTCNSDAEELSNFEENHQQHHAEQRISSIKAIEQPKLSTEELNDLTSFLNNQLNLVSTNSQDFYNTRRNSILDELDIDSDSGLGHHTHELNHFNNTSSITSEMFNKHRSYKIHKT
jgi:serine/threonine protein kinase